MSDNHFDSKLWRLSNLYRIIDRDGYCIPFRLNQVQASVVSHHLYNPKICKENERKNS